MSAKSISSQLRYYQGRAFHQQRDITHRRAGLGVLHVQTWVYRGAPGIDGNEWPARYSWTSRPVWVPWGRTDAQLFAIFCDLSIPDRSPLLNEVEAERHARMYGAHRTA